MIRMQKKRFDHEHEHEHDDDDDETLLIEATSVGEAS